MSSLSISGRKKCINLIANDEGFRGKYYKDMRGNLTIGFGFNLEKLEMPLDIAMQWLEYLEKIIEAYLASELKFFDDLNDARKSVLINMAYHLGFGGLLGFKKMIEALSVKDYKKACEYMKDSCWYRTFTGRATRLINMMSSGEF